jgi:hypothetical protein
MKITVLKYFKGKENDLSIEFYAPGDKKSSLEESLVYVKKLLMIGISGIAYLRTIMPATDFTERRFEGQNIMILSKTDASADCVKLRKWMNGVYDALDKKYVS